MVDKYVLYTNIAQPMNMKHVPFLHAASSRSNKITKFFFVDFGGMRCMLIVILFVKSTGLLLPSSVTNAETVTRNKEIE